VPAKSEECQQENEQRNRQQPDHFTLIAASLARL
jgi:hypothetical protein